MGSDKSGNDSKQHLLYSSSWTPPPSTLASSSTSDSVGKELFDLLKRVEKQEEKTRGSNLRILDIFLAYHTYLENSGGFFGGDHERAELFLRSNNNNSSYEKNNEEQNYFNEYDTNNKKRKHNSTGDAIEIENTKGKKKRSRNNRKKNDQSDAGENNNVKGLLNVTALRKAIFLVDDDNSENKPKSKPGASSISCDENFWLLSIGRILGVGKSPDAVFTFPLEFLEIASDCVTSICEQTKQHLSHDKKQQSANEDKHLRNNLDFCAKTELEIMSLLGSKWLSCLENILSSVLFNALSTFSVGSCGNKGNVLYFGVPLKDNKQLREFSNNTDGNVNKTSVINTITSCLNACVSLVTLLGTKLSRSTNMVGKLHIVAWKFLGCCTFASDDDNMGNPTRNLVLNASPAIMESAAGLLAALPLTGNIGRLPLPRIDPTKDNKSPLSLHLMKGNFTSTATTNNNNTYGNNDLNRNGNTPFVNPSKLWTEAMKVAVSSYCLLLESSYKNKKRKIGDNNDKNNMGRSSLSYYGNVDGWLSLLPHEITSQRERKEAIYHRALALIHLILSLLQMRSCGPSSVLCLEIPLNALLYASELSIRLFGAGAENRFKNSTTANNDISMEGCLLSTNSTIPLLNPIRHLGHLLFQNTLVHIQSSSPFLPSTSHANLFSKAHRVANLVYHSICLSIPEENQLSSTSSRNRSLNHQSLSVRLRVDAIQSFRHICLMYGSAGIQTLKDIDKCVLIIVSTCILPQLDTLSSNDTVTGRDWSSIEDKLYLTCETCDAISAYLNAGKSFISTEIRAEIESYIWACLSFVSSSKTIHHEIKKSILNLVVTSLLIPWNDGGMSSLLGDEKLYKILQQYQHDINPDVINISSMGLSTIESLSSPRTPPLHILTKPRHVQSIPSDVRVNSIRSDSKKKKKTSTKKKKRDIHVTDGEKEKDNKESPKEIIDIKPNSERNTPNKNGPVCEKNDMTINFNKPNSESNENTIEKTDDNKISEMKNEGKDQIQEQEANSKKENKKRKNDTVSHDDNDEIKSKSEDIDQNINTNMNQEGNDDDDKESYKEEEEEDDDDGSIPDIVDSDPDD